MWKLLLISMLSVVAFPSFAAVTLLNHQATPIDVYGTQTTPSFNSSGASLLVVAIAYNQGCGLAFTDSLANVWTALPPITLVNHDHDRRDDTHDHDDGCRPDIGRGAQRRGQERGPGARGDDGCRPL